MRKASIVTHMRIWKIAAVATLALSSFAADNVAPTKSELEEMYNKAFREFDAKNFPQALKELDAIDARQPELAPSQNLRGVILMRQGIYDKAEAALLEAARIDPKFWNARFNLAEIPFLKKDWAEARKRFEQLLSGGQSDLASEASQLIQYKVLLTYLLEGKENMVDSILAKLELSPDTPAVDYVKAAVALQHKNEKEAKDWMAVAEKNFSPQLNKLFAESLYEVGWLEKPAGQVRASLPLMTAAERSEKTKALAHSKFEQAQQALRQRDFGAAGKLVDEADQADPNQPTTLNLRGEILMEQKQFDEAEAAFKRAAKLDPKFREAQYNLAQIPFKKKDYAKARERFEALFKQTPGGDKNQAAQLIKFKIYMTLLLEGKESRAQALMEQFQFTGDTPALYYAQAAWEFKHNSPEKAADWTASAKKIYSPALNSVFADAFYDVGWMQSPEIAAAPGPAFDTGSVIASQTEGSPAIEPSPIPDTIVAANKQAERSAVNPPIPGMEATSPGATAEPPAIPASNESVAVGTGGKPEKVPAAPVSGSSSPVESTAAAASPAEAMIASSAPAGQNEQPGLGQTKAGPPAVATTPTTVAQGRLPEVSQPRIGGMVSRQTLIVGGLLLAGIFLLAWVLVPELRRYTFNIPGYWRARSVARSRTFEPRIAPAEKAIALSNGFFGGPRQVSLRLTASKSPSRGGAFGRAIDLNGGASEAFTYQRMEPDRESPPTGEPVFDSSMSPIVKQTAEISRPSIRKAPELAEVRANSELRTTSAMPTEEPGTGSVVAEAATTPAMEPLVAPEIEPIGQEQAIPQVPPPAEEPGEIPVVAEAATTPAMEPVAAFEIEPIRQEQAIPHQTPVSAMEPSTVEAIHEAPSHFPSAITNESVSPQITTAPTMPEHLEMTEVPAAPLMKTPTAEHASRPASSMHTAVQLTFSLEIASMQLTPSFKMGVLKVRPTSKVVTMRLAPSQQPQPGTNPEVTFEIAKIQPAGGALGSIRMTPSQQQKPTAIGSPSFMVEGSQLVPNFEGTSVQLTPSQQAKASVLVTVPFEINTIEFSPSFEIASVVLNSSSKQVFVQLPGAEPSPGEGTPMFEIANLELSESGDISMMQLNLLDHSSSRT
jgi:Flp pilus assembly protein TadD